jgi:hypothetical protein
MLTPLNYERASILGFSTARGLFQPEFQNRVRFHRA